MIFVTFFGSCIAMALLVASLGTKQWANAKAKRQKNPHESDGRISFGLFDGNKELNVAYGWRTYEIDGENAGDCYCGFEMRKNESWGFVEIPRA